MDDHQDDHQDTDDDPRTLAREWLADLLANGERASSRDTATHDVATA